MSQEGNFWRAVDLRSKKNNPEPVQIGQIIALNYNIF